MCLQCMTEAVIFGDLTNGKHEVLPGYMLMQAIKDDYEDSPVWSKGQYGLVRMNNPEVIWTCKPIKDPEFGLSIKELDELPTAARAAFNANCDEMEDAFILSPVAGFELVTAAIQAGYIPENHGYRFIGWLQNHLAVWMENHPRETHG